MAQKNLVLLLVIGTLVGMPLLEGCSSSKKNSNPQNSSALSESSPLPVDEQSSIPPASIATENLPPPETPAAPPMPTLKDVQLAVYIDSVGYDALSALGFMQELEKTSVQAR